MLLLTSIDYFFQVDIRTGVISWDNVEYLCQWQSQILNNAKFSEDLGISVVNNFIDVSENIKHVYDDVKLSENGGQLEPEDNKDVVTNEERRTQNVDGRRGKIANSAVHEHFYKVKIYHPTTKKPVNGAICKHCKDKFVSRVSTNLKRHLQTYHPVAFAEVESKYIF